MYHKVIVAGHLGRDPEMRYMQSGDAVTNFTVATNRRRKNQDGEFYDETIWVRCTAWGKTAEIINEHFHKGKPILVEGHLNADSQTGGPKVFQRNDGTAGAAFEINVREWAFIGKGEEDSYGGGSGVAGGAGAQEEDEIPF